MSSPPWSEPGAALEPGQPLVDDSVGATREPAGLLLRDCVASLLLSLVLPLAVVVLSVLPLSTAEVRGPAMVLVALLQWVGLAGYPLWAARRRGGVRPALGLAFASRDLLLGLAVGVVSVVASTVVVVVQDAVWPVQTPTAYEAALDVDGTWLLVLVVLFATVGPLAEEIHFRGGWYGALRRRGWGSVPTVLATGVLFAAIHFEPTRFLLLVVPGLLLGWLRVRTDRLGAPVVAHVVVNSLAGVALLSTA